MTKGEEDGREDQSGETLDSRWKDVGNIVNMDKTKLQRTMSDTQRRSTTRYVVNMLLTSRDLDDRMR